MKRGEFATFAKRHFDKPLPGELSGAEPLTLEATAAPGPAELYEVGPVSERLLVGSATSGALIQLAAIGKQISDGNRLLSGLAAWPEGVVYPRALLASPDAGGELRIIVMPGGSAAGGGRMGGGASRGTGTVSTSTRLTLSGGTTSWVDPATQPGVDPDSQP